MSAQQFECLNRSTEEAISEIQEAFSPVAERLAAGALTGDGYPYFLTTDTEERHFYLGDNADLHVARNLGGVQLRVTTPPEFLNNPSGTAIEARLGYRYEMPGAQLRPIPLSQIDGFQVTISPSPAVQNRQDFIVKQWPDHGTSIEPASGEQDGRSSLRGDALYRMVVTMMRLSQAEIVPVIKRVV